MSSAPRKPIIGITCGEIYNKEQAWSPVTFGQSRTYVESIMQAGGVPILLPLTRDKQLLATYCEMVDAICFAGGNDIHPKRYGQEPGATTNDYSELRDAAEFYLMARMFEEKRPILGICRGMQILNVYRGGNLYQDIATELPGSIDHDASTKLETLADLTHTLIVSPGSQLAAILGTTKIGANAHHHQAINKTGEGIVAVAKAEDGIIEAIEMPDYPYAVGVQAHPESLTEFEPRWARLFASFVEAVRSRP